MPEFIHVRPSVTSVEQRTAAIEAAFDERGMKPAEFIEQPCAGRHTPFWYVAPPS